MSGTEREAIERIAATPTRQPPRMSKRELLTFLSATMALMALGIDLMLPAFADIREQYDLGEASTATGQVITVFFFGFALSQLVYGPLADRFGRKPILALGLAIYLVGAVGSALAPSFELLLASRFVWGIGAAGSRTVATAIVRDRFDGTEMAAALSQVMAVFMLVPIIAPTLGTGLIAVLPWQSVFWACAVWALLIALWSLRLRESLDPAHVRPIDWSTTSAGYLEVARTRATTGYTIASVFLQGVFTTYLATSELLIDEVFDRGEQFPYIFGAIAVLFAAGAMLNGRVVERIGIDALIDRVFAVLIPIAVIGLTVSIVGGGTPEFWVYIPLLALTLGPFMLLLPNLNTAALIPVGHLAGTASAYAGAFRIGAGAVIGTVASLAVDDSVTPFAAVVLAMVVCAWLSVRWTRAPAARRRTRSGRVR